NPASDYAFALGLADDLKFRRNRKTYPELIFEMAELPQPHEKDEYALFLAPEDMAFARAFARRSGLKKGETVIGLNTGAGPVFANKAWTVEGFLKLIGLLRKKGGVRLLLLGGPAERERNRRITEEAGGAVLDTGCDNALGRFAALLSLCDLVVTGDTTALHLAIGLKKKVVAIFGPTCAQEIELYGRGRKVRSPLACAPCYRRRCSVSPHCMEAIPAEQVRRAIQALLPRPGRVGV
ncbi:MAG: glycosyltransferase family 9 protein, partial [Deltaproteobacteria bacterium]|nr:glycosyltransferase family 9 protein [Deltaproteobacteria bacterium]